jgi:hypothetical protein
MLQKANQHFLLGGFTGYVAEIIEFSTGKCVMNWQVENMPQSIQIYDSLEELLTIHLHHGRKLEKIHDLKYVDDAPPPEEGK